MAEKKSFVMYYDWGQHFDMLTDEELGGLMKAVYSFLVTGEEPEFDDRLLKVIFNLMRECFVRDNDKWEEAVKKRRENGIKGGKAKAAKAKKEKADPGNAKNEEANSGIAKNDAANVAVNVNDNVNVNVNVNADENVNEKENENAYEKVSEKESETDYEKVALTENELDILYGLTDRLTVENYISKIRSWQVANQRFNKKPYVSIRSWMDQDKVIKEKPKETGISLDDYLAYAASIDYDKLTY